MITKREKIKEKFLKTIEGKDCINANEIVPSTNRQSNDLNNYERRLLFSVARELGYKISNYSYAPFFIKGIHGNTTVIYK